MTQSDLMYFDDLEPGQSFPLGPKQVSRDEVIEFAAEFDAQPMHLDEEAGKASILGGLAASGWHTCALMMRMIIDSFLDRMASEGGPGVDFVSWKRPVLADDTLSGQTTILEARRSQSRPLIGIVRFRVELFNQRGELVLESEYPSMIRARNPAGATA